MVYLALTVKDIESVFEGKVVENIQPEIELFFIIQEKVSKKQRELTKQDSISPKKRKEIINLYRQNITIELIRKKVHECRRCNLYKAECHTQKVPGCGSPVSPLMLIGEGPGFEEDKQGKPFVGRAGKLLDRLLNRLNVSREKIYITNVVKCRPPKNRNPVKEEMKACSPILEMEISIIKPKVIILLGAVPLKYFGKQSIMRERGKWFLYKDNIWVIPTYHPAFLLRKKGEALKRSKWQVWKDFNNALERLKKFDLLHNITG